MHPDLEALVDPYPMTPSEAVRRAYGMILKASWPLRADDYLFRNMTDDSLRDAEVRREMCQRAVAAWWANR